MQMGAVRSTKRGSKMEGCTIDLDRYQEGRTISEPLIINPKPLLFLQEIPYPRPYGCKHRPFES